jgi:hypothetical protein
MAELFNCYPASVVRDITDVRKGLAIETQFLSIAVMAAWLDKRSEPLFKVADQDRRALKQIESRGKPIESQPLLRKMQDWTVQRDRQLIVENEKLKAIQDKRTTSQMVETNGIRAAEYKRAGLDPVYAGDNITVVSLPMMLHMGWRIEKVDGRLGLTRGAA